MRVLTWNVLHRVHAENHDEPAVERWPDEAERVRAVVELLSKAMRVGGVEVALLQEVSGDVLAELRSRLPDLRVLSHASPRVPRQKGPTRSVGDPSEHLVVVAPAGATVLRAQTFANDPGKGFLMVSVSEGVTVVTTHVSWGAKGEAQLAILGQSLRDSPGAVCLGGDFNAERPAISSAFGADVTVSVLPEGSPRTRPEGDGGSDIDHLLCRGADLVEVRVLEHHELSDHRPVAGTMLTGARLRS